MCGSPPIACVLVECKAQHNGKWNQQQHRTSLDQLRVQDMCTVMGKIYGNVLQLLVSILQGFQLYTVNQIARAITGEPTHLK